MSSVNRVFVGGWAGSGSRVLQQILERAGYYVGLQDIDRNESYDFMGRMIPPLPELRDEAIREGSKWLYLEFPEVFKSWYFNRENEDNRRFFQAMIWDATQDKEKWSLKHGHLMLLTDDLKRYFNRTKFILTVRHPVDNLLRNDSSFAEFTGLKSKDLYERLDLYEKLTEEALYNTDFLFRMEDFCFQPHENIGKLFNFMGIDDSPAKYVDIIKVPESIGCRGNLKIKHRALDMLGYF